ARAAPPAAPSTRAAAPPVAKPPVAKPAVTKPIAAKPVTKAKPARSKGPRVPKTTTVVLFHVNRHDTMTLRLRDAQGKPIAARPQQKRFDRFLRCHYTNKQHAMNPRLLRLLYQTGRHYPGKRLEVVSGYRSPTVAKNPHSPHMKGLACDFRVAGVKNTELRDYLRGNMQKVGVGYYPNSSFVHLDVRKDRSAFWIDYSGPGERAMYSQSPAEDLKTGRADQYHPTKIGDEWIDDAATEGNNPLGAGPPAPTDTSNKPAGSVQGTALAGQPEPARTSATP
ncbi:MAG: hypothetical protein JWM82_276, partial [Myxococcales bacterium]|nr:hypothetical protein [Myxococcales bacterium]